MQAFCLESSENSNNRHPLNSTTTPHNPVHHSKPVRSETKLVPECLLERSCSLRLLMVVTFGGKAFSCKNVYILADSKRDFFFPHHSTPTKVCLPCVVCVIRN